MTTLRLASNTRGVFKTLAFASLLASAIGSVSAATITWGGSSGDYLTAANWTGGAVPNTNGGDTAVINGGAVTYTPGGDFAIHSGGKLQINGGSWTQAGGIAWIQAAGGSIIVSGGTFNQGTAANIVRDATTTISVTSGTANLSGNFSNQASSGSLLISGSGVVNIGNEFSPIDTFTLSGGTLNIGTLISFSNGTGTFNLAGGLLSVSGTNGNGGFYAAGPTQGVNFTSTLGSVKIRNYTVSDVTTANLLTNGTFQYQGAIDASKFQVSQVGSDVLISTVSAVPEPSTYAAITGAVVLGIVVMRRRKQA